MSFDPTNLPPSVNIPAQTKPENNVNNKGSRQNENTKDKPVDAIAKQVANSTLRQPCYACGMG
jgi:hypothetical protein